MSYDNLTFGMLDSVDLDTVAILHQTYLDRSFLATLGFNFLRQLYASMIESKHAFCIVARHNAKPVGFISGTVHLSKFYKEFIANRFFSAGWLLLPKIVSFNILTKILETLLYPAKKDPNVPTAELLSIVIDKKYHGQGVSIKLFNYLVDEFNSKNIYKFKIVVGYDLTAACRFYEKMGCIMHSEIEVHRGVKSKIYIWEGK